VVATTDRGKIDTAVEDLAILCEIVGNKKLYAKEGEQSMKTMGIQGTI